MKAGYQQIAECPMCGTDNTDELRGAPGEAETVECKCGQKLRVEALVIFTVEVVNG